MRNAPYLRTSAVTALAPTIWGSTYLVTTNLLPPDRPVLDTAVRALPGGLLLLAAARQLPRGRWIWRSLVLGTLNIAVFNYLLFVAAYHLPGGIAGVIMAVQPMIVLVLGALFLGERIRAVHLLACLLGAGGVALLVLKGAVGLNAVGVLAGLAAAASMAGGITLTKRWGRPEGVGVLAATGWQLVAGGLVILPFAVGVEGLPSGLSWRNLAGFGYLITMGATISYAIWFRGLSRLTALTMSFLTLGSPIVANVLGLVFQHERLSALQVAGIAAILGSVFLAAPRAPAKRPPEPGPAAVPAGRRESAGT
ncbi:EamA family transporter [Kitasatospora sp. NPDC006697]|uniref:EamA family transporter n=1 Tax=Kitasatospora sp. NPDC006697 TaxID=3364020 RepID=UPI003678AD11